MLYSPNAKENFNKILNFIKKIPKSIPFIFFQAYNKKSFLTIENLIDFINLCLRAENSKLNKIKLFLISDCNDVSTSIYFSKITIA